MNFNNCLPLLMLKFKISKYYTTFVSKFCKSR